MRRMLIWGCAALSVLGLSCQGDTLIYRATADFVSNNITSGSLAGISGPIIVEIEVDNDVAPSVESPIELNWGLGSGRVIGAEASVGAFRIGYDVSGGSEQAFDAFELSPDVFQDSFVVAADADAPADSVRVFIQLVEVVADVDASTPVDWSLPACRPGSVDVSAFSTSAIVVIYGPTTGTRINGNITSLEIIRPEPCAGDVTTTGTNPGDAGYGEPDGEVDGSDLSFFVEAWLAGCP